MISDYAEELSEMLKKEVEMFLVSYTNTIDSSREVLMSTLSPP